MNQLKIIENNNQRVLLTGQIAEFYGTESDIVRRNFNRNKDKYIKGKHYFLLEGEELREFKLTTGQIDDSLLRINKLYLWTEKGAFLHAKSLNTDQAWEVYDRLVESYFVKQPRVLTDREQLIASMKLSLETSEELTTVKNDLELVKHQVSEELTLNHGQQQTLHHEIKKRVESIKDDYELTSREIYSQIHSHLRRAFAAPRYMFVKRKDFDEAISWVKSWRPLI